MFVVELLRVLEVVELLQPWADQQSPWALDMLEVVEPPFGTHTFASDLEPPLRTP